MPMSDTLDVDAMIKRFRDRAAAVKQRPLPPVAGAERQLFLQQAQTDFQDFAIIGDAEATLEDGILVLRVDLRPPTSRRALLPVGSGVARVRLPHADVAQLVEHHLAKVRVAGSNPVVRSKRNSCSEALFGGPPVREAGRVKTRRATLSRSWVGW